MDKFQVHLSGLPFAISASVLAIALAFSGFTTTNVIVFNKGRAGDGKLATALVEFATQDHRTHLYPKNLK
jgi:hypothetical protein